MSAVSLAFVEVLVTELVVELGVVLATALDVSEPLLVVVVLEAALPPPCRRYPPTAATNKAMTTMAMATVFETPVLERRTSSQPVTVIVPFIVDA